MQPVNLGVAISVKFGS